MLKELYQQIVADTKNGAVPKLLDLPGGKVLLVVPDTEAKILDKDDVQHSDTVSFVDSLLDWCGRYDEDQLVVKVFQHRITAYARRNEAHLVNNASLNLKLTQAMVDLLNWAERPRSQQMVVTALRTALAGTYDEKILPIFKRLDFQRKNDGGKSIAHTGESLGKSIESRAQSQSGEIPEILAFTTMLYSNIVAPPVTLRFALDIDANQEIIKIAPIGDCIADAYRDCSRSIAEDLKKKLPKALVVCCD